ncbi:unnamed protein product [Prunus armeniaca]
MGGDFEDVDFEDVRPEEVDQVNSSPFTAKIKDAALPRRFPTPLSHTSKGILIPRVI